MTIELAKHVVMFLNASPPKSGMSNTYRPRIIMTRKVLDLKMSSNLHFGAYVQVHEDRNVTNTLEEKTQGGICLGPKCNLQGNYNFFSLRSGKKINRRQFTEMPTPTIVMKRVTAMALPKKQNKGIIFENHTGAGIKDIFPDEEANKVFNKINRNITGVDWEAEPLEQEIQEPVVHIPHLSNNQYAALAVNEDYNENGDDQENDTKSTGVENGSKITGVQYDDKITGVDSNNESTGVKSESVST